MHAFISHFEIDPKQTIVNVEIVRFLFLKQASTISIQDEFAAENELYVCCIHLLEKKHNLLDNPVYKN